MQGYERYWEYAFGEREREIHNDCAFYLAKAEEHPLLEEVIAGDILLREQADSLIKYEDYIDPRNEFKKYLDLVLDLGAVDIDRKDLEERYTSLVWGEFNGFAYAASISAVGVAAVLLMVPPFTLAEPLVALVGGWGIKSFHKKVKLYQDTKSRRDEIFLPVRKAADSLDQDIGRCFIFEHIRHNRKRFETTYRGLTGKESETIDKQLFEMLDAGALDMGQLELERYLYSILDGTLEE